MNRLEVLYDITKKLEKLFAQTITADNRESTIEEANSLLEQRGNDLEKILPPFTEKEKMNGQEIVALNGKIENKMNILFEELKQDMKRVKKQKESNRTYINPYGNIKSTDGMFLDSKQ